MRGEGERERERGRGGGRASNEGRQGGGREERAGDRSKLQAPCDSSRRSRPRRPGPPRARRCRTPRPLARPRRPPTPRMCRPRGEPLATVLPGPMRAARLRPTTRRVRAGGPTRQRFLMESTMMARRDRPKLWLDATSQSSTSKLGAEGSQNPPPTHHKAPVARILDQIRAL